MLDLAQHKSAFQVVIHEGNSIKRIRMSHSHILMRNTRSSAALQSQKHKCIMMVFRKENHTYLGTARWEQQCKAARGPALTHFPLTIGSKASALTGSIILSLEEQDTSMQICVE